MWLGCKSTKYLSKDITVCSKVTAKGNNLSISKHVGVLRISGPEAGKFLHAIVSSDVEKLEPKQSQTSLLLTPAGKLIAAFWIHLEAPENYLIVCEKTIVSKIQENLQKYLIRTKAEIIDVSSDYIAGIDLNNSTTNKVTIVEENYLGAKGLELFINPNEDIESADADAFDNLRISYGVVSNSADLNEEIIPQEANLDKQAVSFNKGCFLGQELVCRIDSRQASTPFSIYAFELKDPLVLNPEEVISPAIYFESEKIATVSSLLSSSGSGDMLSELTIPVGKYSAIARIPRKFVDLMGEEQNRTIEIGFEGSDIRYLVVSFNKVDGNFSI